MILDSNNKRSIRFVGRFIAAGTLTFAFLFAWGTRAHADELPTIDEIIASSQKASKDVQSWSSDVIISTAVMAMNIEMKGGVRAKGNMQHMRLSMDIAGNPGSMESVLDKDGIMWVNVDAGIQKMVMKMDIKKMGGAAGGQGLPGMGMMGGATTVQSPAEVLNGLKQTYNLKVKGMETLEGADVYSIEGVIKDEFKDMLSKADATGAMAQSGMSMNKLSLLVGKKDALVRKLTYLGNDEKPFMTMAYNNVKVNVPVEENEFVFTPPPGAQVMDMSTMLGKGVGGGGDDAALGDKPVASPASDDTLNTRFKTGETAPGFEASTVEGKPIKFSDYKGKVVLLDFWASTSKPCEVELPYVAKLAATRQAKGLQIIGVSLDASKDELQKYLTAHKEMTWPQIFDGKRWKNEVASLYGVNAMPLTVLIDRNGVIRNINLKGDEMMAAVDKVLSEDLKDQSPSKEK